MTARQQTHMTTNNPGQESTAEDSPDDDDSSKSGSSTAGIDETFEILKNNRRRTVLGYLRSHNGSATVKELADFVTADENNVDIDVITSSQRKRVYVSLYQFHLPKMSEMDIVEYDKNRGTVSLTDKGVHIWQSHEDHQQVPKNWGYLSLFIAVFGIAGVAVSVYLWHTLITLILFSIQTVMLLGIAAYQLNN